MITFLSDPILYSEKEKCYLHAREKEGRIYSDEEVSQLPMVPPNHRLSDEWSIRSQSCERLNNRLSKKKFPCNVLDVGCGNGWMSNRLAEHPLFNVNGLDLNQFELNQADRVFHNRNNLKFTYGNVMDDIFQENTFDLIILAAAIQYFPDLKNLIDRLLRLLKKSGEIHILDSPLYDQKKVASAKMRSENYYTRLGVPEMKNYYFHHSQNMLSSFTYSLQNRSPADLIALHLFRNRSLIFPYVIIRNPDQSFI